MWVLEDLHLAGGDLLAFVSHAARGTGRLVLLTARSEVLTRVPAATLGADETLQLAPLEPDATATLVDALVGVGTLPPAVRAALVVSSGGNPLFLEEVLRSWTHSGALRREPQGWRYDGGAYPATLPTTVQAVFQGQIDSLPGAQRRLVRVGSVPGQTFPASAMPELGLRDPVSALGALSRTRGAWYRVTRSRNAASSPAGSVATMGVSSTSAASRLPPLAAAAPVTPARLAGQSSKRPGVRSPRGAGRQPLGFGDRPGGIDQADVAERLREVAQQLAGRLVDLLGE